MVTSKLSPFPGIKLPLELQWWQRKKLILLKFFFERLELVLISLMLFYTRSTLLGTWKLPRSKAIQKCHSRKVSSSFHHTQVQNQLSLTMDQLLHRKFIFCSLKCKPSWSSVMLDFTFSHHPVYIFQRAFQHKPTFVPMVSWYLNNSQEPTHLWSIFSFLV